MSLEDDAELSRLMAAAQGGSRLAYDDLLHRLADIGRHYVVRRVGRAPWVEDVVQEALMTLHRVRHTYDPARPLAPFWYAIVHSRLVDAIRQQRRESSVVASTAEGWLDPVAPPRQERELQARDLRRAMEGLPTRQRRVIELLKLEDLSVRDVAAALGMTESNVKVTAHRGYALLRRRIQEWVRAH